MKKPEILSPAGNMECLKAAVIAGCDAVYLGGYIFGARAFSNNFSNDEIIEAVNFAHGYGVKVYVTVNTLIYENEVSTFMEYIDFLYMNNVDAVIVQDVGMMDLIIQTYPDLEVHASTQMHIHNLEGVKLVEKLGVKRTVLARETSIDKIKEIKNKTNIELEIFVHGALCISYSGQCLMSSLIGGRSGNRGTCAGTCRQKYDVLDINKKKLNEEKYNLSTKDLNSLENIGKLIDIGVDSLKIEGRMKSPSYVYLVTRLYRVAVDSYISTGQVEIDVKVLNDLKKTFNRMFTKGFLFNTSNNDIINPYRPNHLGVPIGKVVSINKNQIKIKLTDSLNINDGIRFIGKEDDGLIVSKIEINGKKVDSAKAGDIITIYTDKRIENNSQVVKTTDYLLNKKIDDIIKNEKRKVKIKGTLEIKQNKLKFNVTDGVNNIEEISNQELEFAINKVTTREEIQKQLEKTGNTIFEFECLNINVDEKYFIPIKLLNDIRRKCLDELLKERRIIKRNYKKENYHREVKEYKKENIKSVYVLNEKLYNKIKNKGFDLIYANEIYDDKVVLKLDRVINEHNNYERHLLVGELGSVNKYNNIDTDFSLNVVNSYTVALLNDLGVKRITLSYEMDDEQIKLLIDSYKNRYNKNPNLSIIVYAKEEMMISKFDLLSYYNITSGYLKDKFNNLYSLTSNNNLMYIYNYKARNLKDINKYYRMGINEVRYNIIDEEDLKNI